MTSPHPTLFPFFVRKRGWREEANNITHYYIVQASEQPPRRAGAAFPSPSCSGKRPKVERWRGVNGLANYVSLPFPAGRGWGCLFGCWRPGHGDPGLLFRYPSSLFAVSIKIG